ncbi:MAG: aminotransferase class V-fold PLP-dependent enzyme, partial [bacterium]|nr:aminotransferase class V-fold PLP-dependent enzyme [bacterium]
MTRRVFNFNAGPATLPFEVIKKASEAVLEYDNQGMSLLEMSHRSKQYDKINAEAEEDMKKLMGLGDDYKVMFMGGGASLQFTMVPMNFLHEG